MSNGLEYITYMHQWFGFHLPTNLQFQDIELNVHEKQKLTCIRVWNGYTGVWGKPWSWATAHFIQLDRETDNMLNFWNVVALQLLYKDFTNWHENQSGSLALIYQSCVEMWAHLHTGLLVWKDARVLPEISIYGWPQCMTQRILINAAAENDQHYVPPLNIHVSEALSAETSLRGATEETELF